MCEHFVDKDMADLTTLELYWCPSLLLTFVTQIVGLVTPFWYQVTWVQQETIRTQHAGLFSVFNHADYFVICGGSDVCEDFDPNSSTSWNYDIGKTFLMAGSVFLLLGSVVSAPGCSKTIGTHFRMLARICRYAACLTLAGCLWIFVTFYCDTITYQAYRSFVSLQLGHSFYWTMLTGCVSLVFTCVLYTLTSIKDARVTQANLHDDIMHKDCIPYIMKSQLSAK
ncbi:uncharacterized protein LOC110460837 isoform X1 [Mizuhopecten yessoensis]|uniref:uncharacterized protein LOC110460837 isoform X1 n=1 Tax=Mizuhopecten yessoensis TaxID=6573 RepID=UPI000B45A837|nr:uncharacterized protein LOC110460837 isoform X1 [Mizuhopecten yessoensis]